MASVDGVHLLHGGYGHSASMEGSLSDLWALEDDVWHQCSPSGIAPLARSGHQLCALHGSRGLGVQCVLWAGFGQLALDDVHLLQGSGSQGLKWVQPTVLGDSPGARCAHAAVATPQGDGMLVFGGYTAAGADGTLALLEVPAHPSPCCFAS